MKVDTTYLNNLLNKLIKIDQKHYPNARKKDGDIGERFVKDSIKFYMWEKGFKLRDSGNRTFNMDEQVKANQRGMGGVDFQFDFEHNNKKYDCYIESKNWKKYQFIPNSMFNKEILDRFTKNANQPGCIWVVTMNKDNIPLISQRCQNNNIHIISIDTKIITNQLNKTSLTHIMEHFLDDFDRLMTILTGVKFRKPAKKARLGSKPYDNAIILGLQPSLIAKMYGTTLKYITKRKSEIKKMGIDVLDGRSKTAKRAKLIKEDQLDDIYIEVIREMIEQESNE
jgi:hypothetical protein